MQQILIDTPATVQEVWYADGVAVDPGTVTVTVTRSDGTVIVSGAATTPAAAFTGDSALLGRAYTIAEANTAALDRLTLSWVSSAHGTLTSRADIVGGFYFAIAEFRSRYAGNEEVEALDAFAIADARATAEEIIEGLNTEDGTHIAFVPRAETFTFPGARTLSVPRYAVRSIDAVTVDGVTQDVSALTADGGTLYHCGWWAKQKVRVTVTHGLDAPPNRIKDAAMILAYHRAVKGPIDDRATGIPTDGGIITLATPGLRGSVTGIPEVDSAIEQYRKPRIVPMSVSLADPANRYNPNWAQAGW